MNFAQLLGPMVGGAIYQAGGFYLPFLTMGSLQVRNKTKDLALVHEREQFRGGSQFQALALSLSRGSPGSRTEKYSQFYIF